MVQNGAQVHNSALFHHTCRAHTGHGKHHAARRQHGAGAHKALRMAQHRQAEPRRLQPLQPLRAQGIVAEGRVCKGIFARKFRVSFAWGRRQRRRIVQKGRFKLPCRSLCHGAAIAARPQDKKLFHMHSPPFSFCAARPCTPTHALALSARLRPLQLHAGPCGRQGRLQLFFILPYAAGK